MPRFSVDHSKSVLAGYDSAKTARARASSLRVHFKNMREVAAALKGRDLRQAQRYLQDVLDRKQAVPFKKFTGGCGRHAQAKNTNAHGSQVGWPVKSVAHFVSLLTNVAANAELKGLDVDNCSIVHVQANAAVKQRRRTYRAHGRIGPYMSNPAHIEIVVAEEGAKIAKAKPEKRNAPSRKALAKRRLRVKVGGQ